jgi:hypothetical protein
MAEMNPGLEQLIHRDNGHGFSLPNGLSQPAPDALGSTGRDRGRAQVEVKHRIRRRGGPTGRRANREV